MNKILYALAVLVVCNNNTIKSIDIHEALREKRPNKHIGLFKKNDHQLAGIKWGNWGSRPYEYYWASKVVNIKNKQVIDLGVGLPSQYDWYKYAVTRLKPAYYVGIDADARIKNEIIHEANYDMLYMDMSNLEFQDATFDIVYCISTFEHIPYPIFIKAIAEAHRVLKNDGLLIFTLDEQWDKNLPLHTGSAWNDLEQSLVAKGFKNNTHQSFGLPQFLELIKEYFAPLTDDIVVDLDKQTIFSHKTGAVYYKRENRDANILASPEYYNSCVSYAVLKKVAH